MTGEIYDHMPKWRRLIRDLAREAGIRNFLNASSEEHNQSDDAHGSMVHGNRPEERTSEK
jgi:hypothetical protein